MSGRLRAAFAGAALLTIMFVWVTAAHAQKTTTESLDNDAVGVKGTKTTTTSADGRTVTTTINKTSTGSEVQMTKSTEVVKKDAQGNILSSSFTSEDTWTDFKGNVFEHKTYKGESKYNELGGHSESFKITDEIETPDGKKTTVDEGTRESDAAGNPQSGKYTKTITQPGKDPEVKHFQYRPGYGYEPTDKVSFDRVEPIDSPSAVADEQAYLPEVAGPSSLIMATFEEPGHAGPSDVIVGEVASDGGTRYYKTRTDSLHHLFFNVAKGVTALVLFKYFDGGKPDKAAVRCAVSASAPVPGTDAVPHPLERGTAIERAAPAYERGGSSKGLFSLQTRGLDPSQARLTVDGSALHVDTLTASDRSIMGRLHDDVSLGRHVLSLESDGKKANDVTSDVVALRADPLPPLRTGSVAQVTVHVDGLPPTDSATMTFQVGGGAELVDGSTTITVPVRNGVAQCRVRGVRAGTVNVRYHLNARIPGFWEA